MIASVESKIFTKHANIHGIMLDYKIVFHLNFTCCTGQELFKTLLNKPQKKIEWISDWLLGFTLREVFVKSVILIDIIILDKEAESEWQ
jgi:hypothetical protein